MKININWKPILICFFPNTHLQNPVPIHSFVPVLKSHHAPIHCQGQTTNPSFTHPSVIRSNSEHLNELVQVYLVRFQAKLSRTSKSPALYSYKYSLRIYWLFNISLNMNHAWIHFHVCPDCSIEQLVLEWKQEKLTFYTRFACLMSHMISC